MDKRRVLHRPLAIVHILVGLACSVIAVPFIGIFLENQATGNKAQQADGQTFLLLFLVYFAPSLIGGIGLLFNTLWARRLLVVEAVAYLFLFPLGTALGVATLLVLYDLPKKAAPSASAAPPDSPGRPTRQLSPLASFWREPLSPTAGVLVAMGVVGPAFVIALNLGFILSHDRVPEPLPDLFYPAIASFIICAFLLVRSLVISGVRPRISIGGLDVFNIGERRVARHFEQEARQRIEHLEASPATRKYGELIRAGQQWSDEAIAYDRDPTLLVTCQHMQPIERALRASGIPIQLKGYGYLDAECCIDPVKLAQRFDLGSTVRYSVIGGDRPGEPDSAFIACREHRMPIVVIVPNDAPPGTPWFPA